jgi:carbonic anhydrase/acetyltransferase-like protein (isoleucine patch superfamily)
VFVATAASVRGDEGQHIHIGNQSNVQDGVVVHGLETFEGDHELTENEVEVDGKKYSVYIGAVSHSRTNLRFMGRPKAPTTLSSACSRWCFRRRSAITW